MGMPKDEVIFPEGSGRMGKRNALHHKIWKTKVEYMCHLRGESSKDNAD